MLPEKFATASFNFEGIVNNNMGLFHSIEDNHLICLRIWSLLSIWLFWLDFTLMMMMISSLSSHLILLSHYHHSLYDCDYDLTVVMTLMMISLSWYSLWLCWWSHCFHHTRYYFDDDDLITVIILEMAMMMILSHIKWWNSHINYVYRDNIIPISSHHIRYDYDDHDIVSLNIINVTIMKITSLSSYSIWLR